MILLVKSAGFRGFIKKKSPLALKNKWGFLFA